MPELHLFLGRDDEIRVVGRALELGCTMAVDADYQEPHYRTIRSIVEYLDNRAKGARLFFLLSSSYSRSPLVMRRIEEGPKSGVYYIKQRHGGPTIEFLCPFDVAKEGSTRIGLSTLDHYSTFYTLSGTKERPPAELRSIYASLSKEVRRDAVPIVAGKQRYWLAPHAQALRERGAKLVAVDDVDAATPSQTS